MTYENKTWIGGKENLGGLKLYGDDEFVTQANFMGTKSNPCIHAYVLDEEECLTSAIDGISLADVK